MKRFFILFVASMLLLSCGQSKTNADISNDDLTTKAINEIVENQEFLSFDVERLKTAGADFSKLTSDEQATVRAIAHRFFSHVKTIDGLWTVDVTSGAEIGMAEDIFQLYVEDINKNMETVKKLRAEGKDVSVPEITEEYISPMLKL